MRLRALAPAVVLVLVLPPRAGLAQKAILLDTFEQGLAPWKVTEGRARLVQEPVLDGSHALQVTGTPAFAMVRPVQFAVTRDTYFTFAVKDIGLFFIAVQDAAGTWYRSQQACRATWAPGFARLIAPRRSVHFPGLKAGTPIRAIKVYFEAKEKERTGYVDNVAIVEAPKGRHLHDLLPKPSRRQWAPNPIEFTMPRVAHPFLAYGGPEGLRRIREAYAKKPFAAATKYVDRANEALERWRGKPIALPLGDPSHTVGQGRCPIHIEPLTFDLARPKWHFCPKCNKNYQGPVHDNGWVWRASSSLASDMRALAHAYAFTGNGEYAAEAVRILEFFADSLYDKTRAINYGDFSDAMWNFGTVLRCFTPTVDLLWDWPGWAAERRASIVDRYLHPRGPEGVNESTSNYGGRGAFEIYRAGIVLERKDMVDKAINGTLGRHLHYLFNDDGIWLEKTFGYQDFVFNYLMTVADQAKRHLGIDVWNHNFGNKSMKTILASYAKAAMPDLRVPAIGDNRGRERGISIAPKMRKAHEVYGDPLFAIHKPDAPPLPAMALRDTGWAILRSDAPRFADQAYVMAVFHRHYGAHNHPDGFSFVMHANGEYIVPDLDTPDYNMKGYWTYYKNASSHNTIVVDTNAAEAPKRYPGPGRLVAFADGPAKVASITDTEGAVRFRRTFVLAADGKTLIDLFQVDADEPHTFDWLFHAIGARTTSLPVAATDALGKGWRQGYTLHSDVKAAATAKPWTMAWQTKKQRLTLWMAGAPSTQVFAAKGLGWLPTQTIDCAIVRRRANSTAFLAVYQALLPADKAKPITHPAGAAVVKVGDIEVAWGDFGAPVLVKVGAWELRASHLLRR